MNNGYLFDIKEFATNDGPGIRLTVFLKGCPLRCLWCHNPEGLSFIPQFNNMMNRIVGKEYSSEQLARHILNFEDVFSLSQGGVTFSGGEALAQSDFLFETALKLPNVHKLLDTSGFASNKIFEKALTIFDLIFFDIKLADDVLHKKYTGVSNKLILQNLQILSKSSLPYNIRIPLIPDITDTKENLDAIAQIIDNLKNLPIQIDLLSYNVLAGGKYSSYNMNFKLKNENNCVNIENVENFISKFENLAIFHKE